MKNQKLILSMVILAAGALWFLFHKSAVETPHAQEAATNAVTASNPIAPVPATKTTLPQPVAQADNSFVPTNAADVAARLKQGLIDERGAMHELLNEENKQSQDFYGKAIDQDGNPVVGLNVTGHLLFTQGYASSEPARTLTTQSDNNGLFQFTDIKGAKLGVVVSKEGYLMGRSSESFKKPPGGKTSPNDRAIITMWKLHPAESLTGSSIDAKIPHDGTSTMFDIATGKESANGSLRVTLSQTPLEVKTGRERFDWTVKVEIMNGGLVEENDAYPYIAPTNGYQSAFEFNVASNALDWVPNLKKSFYVKNAQGQYGIMQFGVYPGRSPTGIEASFTINPSGSQNLEPSSAP